MDGAHRVNIGLTVDKPDPSTAAVELVSAVSRSILLAGLAGAYVSAQEIEAAPGPRSSQLAVRASDMDRARSRRRRPWLRSDGEASR